MTGTNPLLGPTVSNGGPTLTDLPLFGSPSIDAVPLADCTNAFGVSVATDQRGVSRPQGADCDSGSVDVTAVQFFTRPVPPPVASPPGAVVLSSPNVRLTTAPMIIGGLGNQLQHFWLAKTDGSGSLTVILQVGCQGCIGQLPGGGTVTATVQKLGDP